MTTASQTAIVRRAQMGETDPRIDVYIGQAAEFAQPILRHLREVVHSASPDIEETMKWSFPHFMYHGILCSMAAFQKHCAFGFWRDSLVLDDFEASGKDAMGQFGHITAIADLPPRHVLVGYIQKAMKLNESGVKAPKSSASRLQKELPMPESFRIALEQDPEAAAAFARLSPSHRREYVEWVAEAKREETRTRRIRTALEWLAEGKPRNWKYMRG